MNEWSAHTGKDAPRHCEAPPHALRTAVSENQKRSVGGVEKLKFSNGAGGA